MLFNRHSGIAGRHAFLSPSNYHWVNYDDEKLTARLVSAMAARRGSELHEFALNAIRLGIRLPKTKTTLNLYVNDAIGFRMNVEQPLFYSENCFGHADAISFRSDTLRIHDLKTGVTTTSVKQLEVYAALFCLEYGISPHDINMELRIYQNDEVRIYLADPQDIEFIMDKIVIFDLQIEALKKEDRW